MDDEVEPAPITTISEYDFYFFVAAWVTASLTGVLATFLDNRSDDTWDIFAVGCLSGFVAIAVVGFIADRAGGTYGREPYFLAISVTVGLLGRQGIVLAYYVANATLKRLGVDDTIKPPTDLQSPIDDIIKPTDQGGQGRDGDVQD